MPRSAPSGQFSRPASPEPRSAHSRSVRLADRIGRLLPLILACLLFGLASIATVFATSFGQLLIMRIVAGIGLGGAVPSGLALVAESAPGRLRGTAVTAVFSAFPLGGFIGGLAASRLIAAYGWHSVFVIGGALPLLIGFAMIVLMPLSAAPGERARSGVWFRRPEEASRGRPIGALFAAGRAFVTLTLWVPFFLGFMVILTIVLWGPALLNEGGIPLAVGALIFAVHYLGGFVGTACSGFLVDKFGPVRVPAAGFVSGAASLALFGQLTSSAVLLGIDAFFCGLLVVGAANAMLAVAARLYPAPVRSTGIGWAMGVGRSGQVLGPLTVGAMLAVPMSKQSVFFAAAMACVVCAAFAGLLALVAKTDPADPAQAHLAEADLTEEAHQGV